MRSAMSHELTANWIAQQHRPHMSIDSIDRSSTVNAHAPGQVASPEPIECDTPPSAVPDYVRKESVFQRDRLLPEVRAAIGQMTELDDAAPFDRAAARSLLERLLLSCVRA